MGTGWLAQVGVLGGRQDGRTWQLWVSIRCLKWCSIGLVSFGSGSIAQIVSTLQTDGFDHTSVTDQNTR